VVKKKENKLTYTCNDYREEMILAALQKRLRQHNLKEKERLLLIQEIQQLQKKIGL